MKTRNRTRRARTVVRREVVTLPDGTLDRVLVRYLVMPDGSEVPVEVAMAEAGKPRTIVNTKDQASCPATRRKPRRKARKAAPSNVTGMITLKAADLAGVR